MQGHDSPDRAMKVIVCICTCNRPEDLDRLLNALAAIDLAGVSPGVLVETLVVDNRPADGRARRVCEAHRNRLGRPLHFCEEATPGISFARNRAVAEALDRGADFIQFIDDDDLPQMDWLARNLETQRATGADIVMGTWRLPERFSVAAHLSKVKSLTQRTFAGTTRYGIPYCGSNVLIARGVFARLKDAPYRPQFALTGGEDVDFFIRAHAAGAEVVQAANSVVIRNPGQARATLKGVLREAFRIGCTRARLDLEHRPGTTRSTVRHRAFRQLDASKNLWRGAGWYDSVSL
jgi:succinoglycan biosynthesis protein ExoM